jgi:putative heme iron utilization protein
MEPSQALALRSLLESQQVASLATLHNGEPAVSMVPYALLPQGRGFVIHVSRLASHTADMLSNAAVGLLVIAPRAASPSAQALPRASITGKTRQCASDSPSYSQARALYLSRFPESEGMFSFSDFSLFVIEARSVRFVGGFAQARSVTAEQFASIMGADA